MTESFLPLEGLRVVAVEHAVAAPLCTRHLADLGASVIKVERPGQGDFARQYDSTASGVSIHFAWLNRHKRSLSLDLSRPDGRDVFYRLLESADVLVSNLSPRSISTTIRDDEIAERFARLIRCYISGYGKDGPYRDRKAFDLLIQGEAGVTMTTGDPRAPAKPSVSLADLAGGIYACAAISAALIQREKDGQGRRVDISLFDVVAEWMSPLLMSSLATGKDPPRVGMRHQQISPYGPYKTSDSVLINIAVQNSDQWRSLCEGIIDDTTISNDATFDANENRLAHRDLIERAVAKAVRGLTSTELIARLTEIGIPWGNLNKPTAVVEHAQLVERGRWIETALPGGATTKVLADPFHDAVVAVGGRVPDVGEHTIEILEALRFEPVEIEAMIEAGVVSAPVSQGCMSLDTPGSRIEGRAAALGTDS